MLILLSCAERVTQSAKSTRRAQPPNIILLIGDGMGHSQLSATYFYKTGEPHFSRFPVVGMSMTSSAKEKITDSAAGATAIATGQKTYNGAISVDLSGDSLPTLMEMLSGEGYLTGAIATSSITHATPACFYAHSDEREKEEDIALDLVNSQLSYFAGGGKKFFDERADGQNLIASLIEKGFAINQENTTSSKQGYLLAPEGLPSKLEGRDTFLPDYTTKALRFFQDAERPFFLLVEGSQIDWGGHANDGDYIVQEMLDFDLAIGRALDFAEQEGNTLVIVTADHETGGFTLASEEYTKDNIVQRNYSKLRYGFSTGGHSSAHVPVLAYGPGAERFTGIYENTALFTKMKCAVLSCP